MRLQNIRYNYILLTYLLALFGFDGIRTVDAQRDTLRIDIVNTFSATGDSVCSDFVVYNFDSIVNMQYTIRWDPSILKVNCNIISVFDNGSELDTPLVDPNAITTNCRADLGYLVFNWLDPIFSSGGTSIADGTTIFSVCFAIDGDPCLVSPIYISDTPTDIEFVKVDGSTLVTGSGFSFVGDSVTVASSALGVFARHCNASIGNNDGNITFYPCGGTGPYTWTLNGTPQTGTLIEGEDFKIEDLPRGTYTIEVIDSNGNRASRNVIVDEGIAIDFDFVLRDPSCFYRENGRIEVINVTGGFSPYTYEWSTGEFNETMVSGKANGQYEVTITDFLGCEVSRTATLAVDTLRAIIDIRTPAACTGGDGRVELRGEGGVPFAGNEYIYNDLFSPRPSFIYQAPAGWNTYIIEDDNSCIITDSFFMPIEGLVSLDAMIDVPVTCFGDDNGRITAIPTGDSQYTWDVLRYVNGTPTTFVSAGNNNDFFAQGIRINNTTLRDTFIITVNGQNTGCSASDTIIMTQPEQMAIGQVVSDPSCLGNDGGIQLMVSGGTAPYSYAWSDGPNTDPNRAGLTGGDYTVTVSDVNNCIATETFTLQNGGMLMTNTFVTQAIECDDPASGAVTTEPEQPGNYQYAWSMTRGGVAFANTQDVTGLTTGRYYVTVLDIDLGCSVEDSTFIAPLETLNFSVNRVDPTCATFLNGSIGITVLNGTPPYQYIWADDPDMDPAKSVLTALNAGTYNVTIADAAGCEIDTFFTLSAPNPINVDVFDIQDPQCFGDATGSATASANGGIAGTTSFNFLWSSGSTGAGLNHSVSNLSPGTNWVLAADAVCPSDTIFFEIQAAEQITLAPNSTFIQPTCNDRCDGSITLAPSGGRAPYSYNWLDNNSAATSRTNLCQGTYTVQITDSNGCMELDSVTIINPDTLLVSINPFATVDLTCGTDPGQIGVAVIGGADGAYRYRWTGSPSTEAIAPGLQEGNYTVTVTDANGCTATESYELSRPQALTFTLPQLEEPGCFGERTCLTVIDAEGGLGSQYTFSVNLGPLIPLDSCVNLFAGEYLVTVFDSSGRCSEDTLLAITQPDEIFVDAGPDLEIDLGETTDPISLSIQSSNAIDSIMWSPLNVIDCLTPDCQTIEANPVADMALNVTVMDENGCMGRDELMIRVNTTRRVVFPNIFTPNGDNNNDVFQVGTGNGVEEVLYLRIYDRWGTLLFQEENYVPVSVNFGGWDGRYNGSLVNEGVYVVHAAIRFSDNQTESYVRTVTVLH